MHPRHLLAVLGVLIGGCYSLRSDDDDDDTDVSHGDPCEAFEQDRDVDGFGDCSDCDDDDPYVHPGIETDGGCCGQDGRDNDCDGLVDEDPSLCDMECDEPDDDADGWPRGNDCDDHDPAVNPGAVEDVCCSGDGRDNDCDGQIDESVDSDAECGPCDVDQDGDGWAAADDCDDQDPAQSPGQIEYCCPCGSSEDFPYPDCNGEDDDCDGLADETSREMLEDEFCCPSI